MAEFSRYTVQATHCQWSGDSGNQLSALPQSVIAPCMPIIPCFAVLLLIGFLSHTLFAESEHGFKPGPEQSRIVPGDFYIDPPTMENLGFRWYVEGDTDLQARVDVEYREVGEREWNQGLPMLRIFHELVDRDRPSRYRTGNLFAGSVLFLEPGTEYEVRFTMHAPGGGAPEEPKVVQVATREIPPRHQGRRVLNVYPEDFEGSRSAEGRSYSNLVDVMAHVRPGDVVRLHAGTHTVSGGWLRPGQSGEEGNPIVFRGDGAERSIIEGSGQEAHLFDLDGRDHIHFEDLTLRSANAAINGGRRGDPGMSYLVVRNCSIEDVRMGINSHSENSVGWYIADNVITGFDEEWYPRPRDGYMDGSHTGVNLYGRGHVVCYNRISRFSDALAIANIRPPSEDMEKQCVNIDFYNNELSYATDDIIEADYGCHNIRVYKNLGYNAHTGLSTQPLYGGPVYLIRNVLYGITGSSFKFNNHPAGILAYHNTTISTSMGFRSPNWSNGHLRNNLILGTGGPVMRTGTWTPGRSTMDYNGWHGVADGGALFRWRDGDESYREYGSLAGFRASTGHEQNGLMVDLDIFENAPVPEAGRTYALEEFDLRLKAGNPVRDKGERLPNINDDFRGSAPDLGAYETGTEIPHYGPRTEE